jgi:putative Mn2+ efflux pump MntP
MIELVIIAVAVGVDNLRVSLALGWAGTSVAQRLRFTIAFGVAESGMPILGLALGTVAFRFAEFGALVGPMAMATCALLCLAPIDDTQRLATSFGRRRLLDSRWIVVALPLSLGLDNLVAGVALAALDIPVLFAAAVVGLVSSGFAAIGLRVGDVTRVYRRFRWIAAVGLLVIAAVEASAAL